MPEPRPTLPEEMLAPNREELRRQFRLPTVTEPPARPIPKPYEKDPMEQARKPFNRASTKP